MTFHRPRTRRSLRLFSAGGALLLLASCAEAPLLRGQIAGLQDDVVKAEKNGARRCAPRELAMAQSHLKFAAVELDQGEVSNAAAHLAIAEENAHAALAESPEARCVEHAAPPPPPDDKDSDGDHILDSRDQCVLEPEDVDGYEDADGCPEPDNDNDGIPDAVDKCPMKPEDMDGFEDADGCPDPDNDKDTVLDVDDFCPNTPGSPGGARPGCPGLIVVTAKEIRITQQIHFEFNKATIRPESFPILDAIVDVLNANPKITLEIQGHTDNVGSAQYNKKLSQSRADSVRAYLGQHGISVGRLVSVGYGMSQPVVPNNTASNRALNRRVQFIRTEGAPP
jgi:outer membrane protein OmpA-like peptidoglycan-associated protein